MLLTLCSLIIAQITNFPGKLSFFHILKFHDFSMTGKPVAIFPGAVETLNVLLL